MRIANNVSALNAWRNLTHTDSVLNKSLERLSSGLRVNRAADDAAGLAISEKMRAQVKGLNQAIRNAQDGISMIQTAEGALTESHSILQRIRELAVQASNDTLTSNDRAEIQKEVDQLVSELDRIGNNTEFNTKKLINGETGVSVTESDADISNASATGDTQTGTYAIAGITVGTRGTAYMSDWTGAATAVFAGTTDTLTTAVTLTVNGKTYSLTAGTSVQDVIDTVNADSGTHGVRASYDTGNNVIKFEATNVGSKYSVALTSSVANVDEAGTMAGAATTASDAGSDASILTVGGSPVNYSAEGNRIQILSGNAKGLSFTVDQTGDGNASVTVSTNGSMTLQVGANANQGINISIGDMRAAALGVDAIDVSTKDNAAAAMTTVDNALSKVSTERANLGAVQNRLEHTIANLGVSAENLTAAESRIRDVDMALEMAAFTRSQILLQAGTAMMAQANMKPQTVLQLLR